MCSHLYGGLIVKCSHFTGEIKTLLLLLSGLAIDNFVKATLFTSDNAKKLEVCAISFAET